MRQSQITWFKFFGSSVLLLACFLFFQTPVSAAEFSPLIPTPTITSFKVDQVLSGPVIIKGTSLNYSQVKVYLDSQLMGQAKSSIGTQGWQDFELTLPEILAFGGHEVSCVAEYFNNTQSATTTLGFNYQAKIVGPTLFDPVLNTETNYQQPWLVGVALNDSLLEIYVDEQLDGELIVGAHPSGVMDFKYQPKQKLAAGFHLVKARAKTPAGLMSGFSNEIIFEVRVGKQIFQAPGLPNQVGKFIPPVPAPTLLAPQNGSVLAKRELVVSGVVHNEHYVKIFVDDRLMGEFMPPTHSSGVTSFTWYSAEPLSFGSHKIWAECINPRGQTSGQSNILYLIVLPPEKIFVSQLGGQIASLATQQPLEQAVVEEKGFDKTNHWAQGWQYLIGLVILIALMLLIIWFWLVKKEKSRIIQLLKKVEKNKPANKPPVIEGPEISYDNIEFESGINNKEIVEQEVKNVPLVSPPDRFPPSPPPPPSNDLSSDSWTLGI